MSTPANKRVAENAAILCRGGATQTGYKSAAPGGPAGSSLMTFAAVFTWLRGDATSNYLFSRAAAAGWWIRVNTVSGAVLFAATNAGGVNVESPSGVLVKDRPNVCIGRYNNGAMQGWLNGISIGTTTNGNGFLAAAVATMIGTLAGSANNDCQSTRISECVMLDGYDVVASYNTAFGAGAAGLTAQWQEDLQQGRYLARPAGVADAGYYYWSARDAIAGPVAKATWTDRGTNAVVLNRNGAPQGCSL